MADLSGDATDAGRTVHYEVETSLGRGIVVYDVGEVFIYIPAELSAAGFELKIAGRVRITDQGDEFFLNWTPSDLTKQDVACLYSAEKDGWTLVDEFAGPYNWSFNIIAKVSFPAVETPVLIESQELSYPDRDYRVGGMLDMPEPSIVGGANERSPGGAPTRDMAHRAKGRGEEDEEAKAVGTGSRSFDKDPRVTSHHASKVTTHSAEPPRADAINFGLSTLHSIREKQLMNHGRRSLTFYLLDGRELPTLYFHDGGTSGLLQALQRYMYLTRDPKDQSLLVAKDKSRQDDKPSQEWDHAGKRATPKKGIENILHEAVGAVGNIIPGLTRAVRQHLMSENRQLLEVRPGTVEEEEEELEERLQTVAYSEVGSRTVEVKGQDGKAVELDPDASLITDFTVITDLRGKLPTRPPLIPRQSPLTAEEWESLRGADGRVSAQNERHFRARVFAGGMDHQLRKEVWRYLLNYFPFDATDIERMELRRQKEREYLSMKQQWQSFTAAQEKNFTKWREIKVLINKDVLRTDRDLEIYRNKDGTKLLQLEDILRTYVMYNFDLGYVQGMSDLLAPILAVMDNEVDAFWCFVGYMNMVGHHFEESQGSMRNRLKQLRALLNVTNESLYQFLKGKETHNLYFCFRWLLVDFKREFCYEDVYKLWEVMWTGYLSRDYALFIALAIIEIEKTHLHNPNNDFSDILQHINGLAKKISLNPVLELAESICRQVGKFPSLPTDLQSLVVKPMPPRLETFTDSGSETVVCNPDSSAVQV